MVITVLLSEPHSILNKSLKCLSSKLSRLVLFGPLGFFSFVLLSFKYHYKKNAFNYYREIIEKKELLSLLGILFDMRLLNLSINFYCGLLSSSW